uniref:Short-chain collagen C4 n=1 Tax=Magallana gigas TaxID=29159 RepID=K1QIL0_MAGGI
MAVLFLVLVFRTAETDTTTGSCKDMLQGYLTGQLSSALGAYQVEALRREFKSFTKNVEESMKIFKEKTEADIQKMQGYVGGSSHDHKGAAVDPLCLPRDPEWGIYSDVSDSLRAFVFGTEYETSTSPANLRTLHDHDVPCAVCLRRNRSVVKMFPARKSCYKGWKLEYHGYLISVAAVDLLCLTRDSEWGMYSDGTDGDQAFVFGAEYETATSPGNMHTLSEHDIPCVVCLLNAQNSSVVYTRWGKKTCPSDAEIVLSGFTGGSYYGHKGAAVDPLCLPKDPEWGLYTDGTDGDKAYVYGAEYETATSPGNLRSLYQHDVPCAICLLRNRSVVKMFPARKSCYRGWKLEYRGNLMTGYHDHLAGSMYTCVDEHPDTLYGGHTNKNGYLFHSIEARCGSLKCPPYVEGREIVCVVCSKE